MNKNYYNILEISQNASPEIIEKAYKTLVKKYHPDLQKNNFKEECQEKLKEINEAYDILSDPDKRKDYDESIIYSNSYIDLMNENINLKNELNYLKNNYNIKNKVNQNFENYNYKNIKINSDKLKKDLLALVLTILIIICIGFILFQIPAFRNSSTLQHVINFFYVFFNK